jgi:hypothetical protein
MTLGWSKSDLKPRHYLLLAAITALIVIGAPGCFLFWAHSHGRLVAPALTGNVSFDEKVRFLRNNPTKQCDVLVIGSSMALFNLESETILKHLPPGAHLLNAGSWNMKIGNTRAMLECLLRLYQPRTVILACGPMDFYKEDGPSQFFDSNEVVDFIKGSPYWLAVLRHFDLQYYVRWSFKILQDRTTREDYYSMMFDPWGGIPYEIYFPKVDQRRWNQKMDPAQIDSRQYDELSRIADIVRDRGMQLICVQPPLKQGSIPAEAVAGLEEHWERIGEILNRRGFELLNLQKQMTLSDEYFADYSHLNHKGAVIFSDIVGRETAAQRPSTGVASNKMPAAAR